MHRKSLLSKLPIERQNYYHYLASVAFREFSLAERLFETFDNLGCIQALFRCSEFVWKSLTILSGKYFDEKHEILRDDYVKQLSVEIVAPAEKANMLKILSQFSNVSRLFLIYGYYEKGVAASPPAYDRTATMRTLDNTRELLQILREIHYTQVFVPKIRIGVLSGYVSRKTGETPCTEYTWCPFKTAQKWVDDLSRLDGGSLFESKLLDGDELPASNCPIVINPFGETFPEIGSTPGFLPVFDTISEYIRNGGIFVSIAGNPFNYVLDVSARSENRKSIVSGFPIISSLAIREDGGELKAQLAGTTALPLESLLVNRTFGVTPAWDALNRQGPVEMIAQYSDVLKVSENEGPIKARALRPIKPSERAIPLIEGRDSIWGQVYLAAAVRFGRGFLICFGMPLENQAEFNCRIQVLRRLAQFSFLGLILQ